MFGRIVQWLLDTFRGWLAREGEERQTAADNAKEIADVKVADEARAAVDRSAAGDPAGLRADDGFERRD